MLMLLSVHVTSFLFLVRFNNFTLNYGLLLELHVLTLVTHSYALLTQVYHSGWKIINRLSSTYTSLPLLVSHAHTHTHTRTHLESVAQCMAYILARWPRSVFLVRRLTRPIAGISWATSNSDVSATAIRASCEREGDKKERWINNHPSITSSSTT